MSCSFFTSSLSLFILDGPASPEADGHIRHLQGSWQRFDQPIGYARCMWGTHHLHCLIAWFRSDHQPLSYFIHVLERKISANLVEGISVTTSRQSLPPRTSHTRLDGTFIVGLCQQHIPLPSMCSWCDSSGQTTAAWPWMPTCVSANHQSILRG